jgi:hypothetical protein
LVTEENGDGLQVWVTGRVKFSSEKIVCPLRVLKWPFIGELAWKRPNHPVGETQDPCGIWQNL